MSLVISSNVRLAEATSWLVGGNAEYFCMPNSLDQLREAFSFARSKSIPTTILGGGSNVLISDHGVRGLVIGMKKLNAIESKIVEGRLIIQAQAGVTKSELLKIFLKNKLAPALFLAGLPGDVGGGIVMNAGVAELSEPREFMEFVDHVEVMDHEGHVAQIKKGDLGVAYRHTTGWQPRTITGAQISWPHQVVEDILQKVKDANRLRLARQPLDKPSCGSVFKNPPNYKSAQLIDQCGLKGYRRGDAQVSLKHANFIVNLGEATAEDIWHVVLHVKNTVMQKTGVSLTTEMVRLGHWTT